MLPIVVPFPPGRSIALLDYDGNLVTMELGSGQVKAVAAGVESIVDLSVSNRLRFACHAAAHLRQAATTDE